MKSKAKDTLTVPSGTRDGWRSNHCRCRRMDRPQDNGGKQVNGSKKRERIDCKNPEPSIHRGGIVCKWCGRPLSEMPYRHKQGWRRLWPDPRKQETDK